MATPGNYQCPTASSLDIHRRMRMYCAEDEIVLFHKQAEQ